MRFPEESSYNAILRDSQNIGIIEIKCVRLAVFQNGFVKCVFNDLPLLIVIPVGGSSRRIKSCGCGRR